MRKNTCIYLTKVLQAKKFESLQSELDACQSGNIDSLVCAKELELCRDEIIDGQNAQNNLNKRLQTTESNRKTLEKENDSLRNQFAREKAENQNLQNQNLKLQNEYTRIEAELSRNRRETANRLRVLTGKNLNLQNALDTCQSNQNNADCKGPIVGNNRLSLLKTPSEIELCQNNGIYEKPKDAILMFYQYARNGENELAVITRGLSSSLSQSAEKYKIGNEDKIITSFNTNGNVKYSFASACSVIYQGLIHFFGGWVGYENQHFGFDEKRNFVKYKNLEMDFSKPQCSTFKIEKINSNSGDKEVVLLCFDYNHKSNCYQYYDGELTHFKDANKNHYLARLGKYKDQVITVGDGITAHQKTEILDQSYDGQYRWTIGTDYNFFSSGFIFDYSMVNVPRMGSR